MYQLRKVSVCQKSSIRDISFALGHYDIIFPNYNEVREEICRLYSFYYGDNKEKIERIANKMHMNEKPGTAKGADLLGERFASTYGYKIVRFPANWTRYGKSAGPIRNEEMAKYAAKEYGVLFAFWNGSSRGTKSMIEFAKQYGLEIHIIPINQSIKKKEKGD